MEARKKFGKCSTIVFFIVWRIKVWPKCGNRLYSLSLWGPFKWTILRKSSEWTWLRRIDRHSARQRTTESSRRAWYHDSYNPEFSVGLLGGARKVSLWMRMNKRPELSQKLKSRRLPEEFQSKFKRDLFFSLVISENQRVSLSFLLLRFFRLWELVLVRGRRICRMFVFWFLQFPPLLFRLPGMSKEHLGMTSSVWNKSNPGYQQKVSTAKVFNFL